MVLGVSNTGLLHTLVASEFNSHLESEQPIPRVGMKTLGNQLLAL